MHPFLIEIYDLLSLLRLTDTLLQLPPPQKKKKEFVFCNNRKYNYKLDSPFGHFKSTWYSVHYFSCCQTYRNCIMLQKTILCKNELYFLSHVTVDCLWVCYKNCHTSCGKRKVLEKYISYPIFWISICCFRKKWNLQNFKWLSIQVVNSEIFSVF